MRKYVVRVKVHPTFQGDMQTLIDQLCAADDATFVKQDGEFLIFWRPIALPVVTGCPKHRREPIRFSF